MLKFKRVETRFLKILSFYRNTSGTISNLFFFLSISRTSRKNTFQEERSGNLEKEGNVSSRKLVLGPVSLDPGAPKAEA